MASRAAKGKKGNSQTKLVFAPMPGKSVATGGGLTNFSISDAGIERYATKPGRWLEPGEAVSLHGFTLPDGMIYFGATIPALSGYGTEPSLVDPSLPATKSQTVAPSVHQFFAPDYKSLDPARRWKYLQWLSHGRSDPQVDGHLVYLFCYGLERRIIAPYVRVTRASQRIEAPLSEYDRDAIRDEIVRLAKCYNHPSFQSFAAGLVHFLDLTAILADPKNMDRLIPEGVAALPRTGGALPPLLAVRLARFAFDKQPLPAAWAWAWFCHDEDSNMRAVMTRCPKEMGRLFSARFAASVGPKGITPRLTKSPISMSYYPSGPSYPGTVSASSAAPPGASDWLRQVSRTPLKAIREIAYACMDELDAYSRRVGRDPNGKHTLLVVALLPDPLFQQHDAAVKFRAWLNTFVPAEPGIAATLPAADLVARWQGSKAAETLDGLSRSEALTLVDAIERLGFAVEPNLRTGGPPIAGPTAAPSARTLVAAIARRSASPPTGASIAVANATLFAVGLPLLVRAARAGGSAESPALLPFAMSLPGAAESDRATVAVRLAYLVANPKESAKLPKPKELALDSVTAEERAQIGDILVSAASLSGFVSAAGVTELIRLFALLGLPDSEVYGRLHASASAGAGLHRRSAGADDTLATVRTGKAGSEFAIPPPTPRAAKKTTAGAGVAIDHALVRQKQFESAQISSLLADIFTDEETLRDAVAAPILAPAAPAAGRLDTRHAALLRALIAKESWTRAEFEALARAENLLPNAAIERINEAAFERFDEPVLDGDDPIYVTVDLAKEMLS